jgi:hypothetical protein
MKKAFPGAESAPLLSLSEVCDLAGQITGKRPSPSTVFRWVTRGAGGARLPGRRIGGRYFVLRSAALDWFGGTGSPRLDAGDTDAARAVSALLGRNWGCAESPAPRAVKGRPAGKRVAR